MHRLISPSDIAPPVAHYVHGVLSEFTARALHTSGVVPIDLEGNTPSDLSEQAELVWANLAVILHEAKMEMTDIVSITTYVVHGNDLAPVMEIRDKVLEGHLAASTLVTVPGLARPEWQVEISVIATR